jgi:hypothetical protein
VPPEEIEAADRATWSITWRLRGFLGGSGTAMTSSTDKRRRIDEQELYALLRDAANEIDRLNAALPDERSRLEK